MKLSSRGFIVLCTIAAVILGAGFLYYRYEKASAELVAKTSDPEAAQEASGQTLQAETQSLISKVGKLMDLPKEESPTVATVTDSTKLAGLPFASKVKNGDKLLIYPGAQKLVLYDPQENKIVDVEPLRFSGNTPAQVASYGASTNR